MIITADNLKNFPMPELRKMWVDQIGIISVVDHFYIILQFGVVDLTGCRIELGFNKIITIFICCLGLLTINFLFLACRKFHIFFKAVKF